MLEFQTDLLRFLAQAKDGRKYISALDSEFFDLNEQATVFSLLKDFDKKYGGAPSLGNMLEYFDKQILHQKQPVSNAVYKLIEDTIRDVFKPFKANAEHIRDQILEQYQITLMKNLFKENAKELKNGDRELVNKLHREITRIKSIGDHTEDDENNRGQFLIADHKSGDYKIVEGAPTYLDSLNKMTSTGGFYSPQLIILMGAPKSFKTGALLNIGVKYARDGYNVYYADAENGQDKIRDRARQAMLECSVGELHSGEMDATLDEIVGRFKSFGGDFRADYYPAYSKTMNDVEAELDWLRDTHNWVPDMICYDYLDLFNPIDFKITEKRLKIQAVYHDAIKLQKRRGIFGFTLSQVKQAAVGKTLMTMGDFAEDFGKAHNCHAAFAICRDEVELQSGLMRLVPVAQRDGLPAHSNAVCFMQVSEGKMSLNEINFITWKKLYELGEHKVKIKNTPLNAPEKIDLNGKPKLQLQKRLKLQDR